MNKKVLDAESEFQNINASGDYTKTTLRVATLCKVTSVDQLKGTISAKPLVREKVETSKGVYDYIDLPELENVPFFTGGLVSIQIPIVGQYCVCIHLDRGAQGYTENDLQFDEVKNDGVTKHALSECVAFVGFRFFGISDRVSDESTDGD